MTKRKLLAVIVGALAMVAMSTAPASATFKSLLSTKGQIKIHNVTFETGGLEITCQSASGEWHLQSAGKFEEAGKEGKQVAALSGPHLYLAIAEWSNCSGEAVGFEFSATVEACELQVVQATKGSTTGTVAVIKGCVFNVGSPFTCTITMSAGSEVTGVNASLKGMSLETNKQTGLLLMAPAVESIKGTTTCEKSGKFTDGKLKGALGSISTEGGVMLG